MHVRFAETYTRPTDEDVLKQLTCDFCQAVDVHTFECEADPCTMVCCDECICNYEVNAICPRCDANYRTNCAQQ